MYDDISGAPVCISWPHHMVHDGKMFTHSGKAPVASGATYYHLIRVGARIPHIRLLQVEADGAPLDVLLFESSTVSAAGTLNSGQNGNRISSNVAVTKVYDNATISADGVQLAYFMVQGSKQEGGLNKSNPDSEWILKVNTDYVVKTTNNTVSTVNFNLYINWYE